MSFAEDDRFPARGGEAGGSSRHEAASEPTDGTPPGAPEPAFVAPHARQTVAAGPAAAPPHRPLAARPMTAIRGTDRAIDPTELPRAHFLARFAAWIVDLIILGLMNAALVWVAASAVIAAERVIGHPLLDASDVVSAVAFAGSFALGIGYFVVLHAYEGQTLGKAAVRIRVQAVNGEPLGVPRSAVRWVGYIVSAIPLFVGFLWALLPARRAWHDYLAGTVVVRV
jgi:uncharacterized RDD family membrane protein YckC